MKEIMQTYGAMIVAVLVGIGAVEFCILIAEVLI